MKDREKFYTEGSPLQGHHVPPDWKRLDRPGRWQALQESGIARSMEEARSFLARHAAACKKVKAARKLNKGGWNGR